MQFVDLLAKPDNLRDFLNKYSGLKSIIGCLKQNHMAALLLCFQRLEADWSQLCETFYWMNDDSQLSDIQISGDSHCGGKQVVILKFTVKDDTHHLVYKPRDLQTDLAFKKLLQWHNQHNLEYPHYIYQIINRETYAWTEFVNYQACQNGQDLREYYIRLGSLLCLCYLVNVSDIHYENLIASGLFPVLIDMECMLKPLIDMYAIDEMSIVRQRTQSQGGNNRPVKNNNSAQLAAR